MGLQSHLVRGVVLAVAAASTLAAAPISAQSTPTAAQPRKYDLSVNERAALRPVQVAINAKDWSAATAALPAASAAAQRPDAKYVLGQLMLQIGIGTNDERMQADAVDTLIASRGALTSELPALYRNQGALALRQNNRAQAEAAFARLIAITPNDADAIVNLARIKADGGEAGDAVALMRRAITLKRAAGQVVDETWYKYALKVAYDKKLAAQAIALGRELTAAYPTGSNWRDSLLVYRDMGSLDPAGRLDLLRLMRVSGALAGERDWYDYADTLNRSGYPGEAKAVLDQGVALQMIDPKKVAFAELLRSSSASVAADRASLPRDAASARAAATGTLALKTADAYYGYGDFAEAAALYRAAIAKGGVDAGTAQLRLGMALAQGGKRAEAITAFRAVRGPKADLAAYWLTWLSRAP